MSQGLIVPTPLIPAFLEALPTARAILTLEIKLHMTTYPTVPPCCVCGEPSTYGHLTDDGYVGECEEHREVPTIKTEAIVPEDVCGPITYIENMLNDMLALNRAAGAIIEMDEMDRKCAVLLAVAVVIQDVKERAGLMITGEQIFREQIRELAIEIVQAHQGELSVTDLINELTKGNVDENDARRTAWYLVSKDRLLLTRDFKLKVPGV